MCRFSRTYGLDWDRRARIVVSSSDNAHIPRVENAGRVVDGLLVMHNGLKVLPQSYYGEDALHLFAANRGVHEPQEERAFQEVLRLLPPGGVMLELGAYWGFYSMWFLKAVPGGRAILLEASAKNLEFGRRNLELNGLEGRFIHAYAGGAPGTAEGGIPVVSVDDLVEREALPHLTILHADIQGAEVGMLGGCAKTFARGGVSWCFISTHGEGIHQDCERLLTAAGLVIEISLSPAQSFAYDGVLVARAPSCPPLGITDISRRTA